MDRTQLDPGLSAWLGPARDDLTDEQLDRVTAASHAIDARYPDSDDSDLREAALSAAVQYLLGDTTPEDVGRAHLAADRDALLASAAAQQVAVMLTEEGMSEVRAADAVYIARGTLRAALGK